MKLWSEDGTVLVASGDAYLRHALARSLAEAGLEVVTAEGAGEAFAQAWEHDCSAVFAAGPLPGLETEHFLTEFAARHPDSVRVFVDDRRVRPEPAAGDSVIRVAWAPGCVAALVRRLRESVA